MRGTRCFSAICSLAALAVLASPAAAIEFWDGRLEIHGYYEQQIRTIANGFNASDNWDLTQWYHVLNVEIEADIAPDGFGPFDVISAFGRVEVRYDCVWTRGCGIFSSADTYGDRARRLPRRLLYGRRDGYTLSEFDGDTRRFRQYTSPAQNNYNLRDIPTPSREPLSFGFLPGLTGLSPSKGLDGILGTEDDPFPYYTGDFMDPKKCLVRRPENLGIRRPGGNSDTSPHTGLRGHPERSHGRQGEPPAPGRLQPDHRRRGKRRAAAPTRTAGALRASQGPRGGGPGPVAAQPRSRRDVPEGQVRELRPELQPGRAVVEPRREPAGREGTERALRRHGALRRPPLAAARQAEYRLGQDGAVPDHRPVQSPGSRSRLTAEPGGVPGRPLGATGGLVLLRRRALRGPSPRGGDELRRVRADRPRSLRRALFAAWCL